MPPSGPHTSLRRAEAESRARTITVTQMVVELDLTSAAPEQGCRSPAPDRGFASTTTISFDLLPAEDNAKQPEPEDVRDSTFVDFRGEELLSATLNGEELPASSWRAGRIELSGLLPSNTLVVRGKMAYSTDGEGLHRHVDPADQRVYLYAMSFLDAAPRWFACFDQPDLKAPYELRVSAPAHWTVLGNGPSVATTPGHWRIRVDQPMSTYFVTLVAGPYTSVRDEHDGIPLGFHVRASLGDALQREAADLIAVTKAGFDYFHRVFGVRYPFGEYHQAFVPDFNAGAMENPGCVTLRDQYVYRARATRSERAHRAGTMVHEMAHMWFGNLVTMRWWDDLWLNESFAEYLAHRACEEIGDYPLWTEFGIVRKDWGSIADQGPSTHPVATEGSVDSESALQNFDGISYAKGAAVLKQLVAHLGDEVFLAGLRRYFDAHAFANAEFADLMRAWTGAGAVDLEAWAASWLRTSGLDLIDVVAGHGTAMVTRTSPPGQDVPRTHAIRLGAVDADGRIFGRTAVQLADRPVGVEVPEGVELLIPDVEDDTWARIRFGEGRWPSVATVLPGLRAPSARVVVYTTVRDAVRNAELDPATALDLICAGIITESSDVIVDTMLGYAEEQLAGPYAASGVRSVRLGRVRAVALTRLAAAEAGSDDQLTAFRLAVRTAGEVALLRRWLDGGELPAGIVLDSELVWALVDRLTSLGGDMQLIEDTLRRDPSAAADVHAARARAGLPSEEAKSRAWRLLTQPSPLRAYQLYATASGFFRPHQDGVTAPFASRYFSDLPDTAGFRSGWLLGQVALLAYPRPHSSPQILALADGLLARDDLAAPLRRSVLDETDRLRRAVSSRSQFA